MQRFLLISVWLLCATIGVFGQDLLTFFPGPDCPEHQGSRQYRSAVVSYKATKVFATGTASLVGKTCTQRMVLTVERNGRTLSLPLPATSSIEIVSFTEDGSGLVLTRTVPVLQYFDLEFAVLNFGAMDIRWRRTSDALGWKDCYATYDTLGLHSGRLVLKARETVYYSQRNKSCVKDPVFFAMDTVTGDAKKLSAAPAASTFGKVAEADVVPCKEDPDLVGACYAFHGRLSYYNGGPSTRIWRVGTTRMLGVITEHIPDNIDLDWDHDVFAEFVVCPFSKNKPGHMQAVCIESAKNPVRRERK